MNNIQKVGRRNGIKVASRRYALSDLISESYSVLYDCDAGSKLYKLAESHIDNVRKNPEDLSALSRDLCTLKGLVSMKESALIKDSDLTSDVPAFTNDMKLNQKKLDTDRDVEEMDDADVINEEEDIVDDEDEIIEEEEDIIDDEDEIVADEEIEEEDEVVVPDEEEEDEITNDELVELKKHLKEMRRARKMREAKKAKAVKEARSWASEKSSMSVALKHFRESSTNKAFYNTFSKMSPRLKDSKPLSIQESLLLYKASNSAMTQLAIELERNPEFIYTFRECTAILSEDTKSLLECIKQHKAPGKSLVESLRTFSDILLESEEEPEDYEDYEEEEVTESEAIPTEPEEPAEPEVEESIYEEEEVPVEDEIEEEEEIPTEDIVDVPDEDEIEENEDCDTLEDEIEEEEELPAEDELEEEEETEITDEEAMALKKKLDEIRKRKASR